MRTVAGIFVGGAGRRLGGIPKGLLQIDGEAIVTRTRRLLEAAACECVLVGEREAYASEKLPALADDPRAEGPLAGLLALLEHAKDRPVLAIACDMPFVSEQAIRSLLAHPTTAAIVAPRRDDRWEPFFARYDPVRVLPLALSHATRGDHRLQSLFDDADVLVLDDARVVQDWDTPDDLPPGFTDVRLRVKGGR